ncbi:MAG: hypothetical protein Q7R77_00320 [Candidatus Daviesbacteria bacterium]|nr:hypothetical protein [Candidatus Daviesbacteria bacterium]
MTAIFKCTIYNLQCTIKPLLILFAFIFTFYILHFTFLTPAFAQTAIPATPLQPAAYSLPPVISPTSPLYTDLLLNNMFHSFSCLAIGSSVIGQPCLTYQITKNAQGMIQSVPMLSSVNLSGGTLGAVSSLIGALYLNPPVRTADYLASVGQGLGIVKTANAQVGGSGASVLSPIIKLWQVSRNISYVVMIIIFLIIGMMVMFRNKINPQTVITAQAALPGLVIGLILITFSYFLAGLISDMAFVGTNVVGYYFSATQPPTDPATPPQNLVSDASDKNVIGIFSRFAGIISPDDAKHALDGIWNNLPDATQYLLATVAGFMAAQFSLEKTTFLAAIPHAGNAIQAVIATIATVTAAKFPTTIVGLVLSWIATLILLYSMFKLLLRLVNSFLSIIFLTVTAPFHFLAASLPGRQSIATNWMLNMLSNVLAFPAVMGVFYFVAFLMGPDQINSSLPFVVSDATKVTGILAFPLLGGLGRDFINILLAFGALVALPTIPDIISRTLGRASQAGQLLGQGISAGVGAGMGYYGRANQGANAASNLGARARGWFGVPGYKLDKEGRIIETYEAGRGATFGAIAKSQRFGGLIRRVTGGRIGKVPSQEKNIENSTPA